MDGFWNDRRLFDAPTARMAKLTNRPFKAHEVIDRKNLSSKELASMNKTSNYGISDGIVFPLKGRFNRVTYLAISGDPEKLSKQQIWVLWWLSTVFYQRACELDVHSKPEDAQVQPSILSSRQRQCLTWVAIGKTDGDIAEILGITKRTVHFHVENAKERLNAHTRLQAVINATNSLEILP